MKIRRFTIPIFGLILSSALYIATVVSDFDLFERLCSFLATREHLELDEFIVPFFILLCFVCVNEIIWRKKLEVENEKNSIHKATLWSSQYVLNNFLNQMLIFKQTAEHTPDFNPAVLALFDDIVDDAQKQIEALNNVESLSEEEIRNSVLPYS